MTAESAEPPRGAFTRGRLAFRRWRRTRPFWGGLLLILSGAWILLSANRDLGNLQIHLGMAGFQSYVIPVVLILCGALSWVTPAQRIFYGIIGVLVAIYSLIGANLGGFIIGFLLGTFGGGLCVAWVPVKRPGAAATTDAAEDSAADTVVQDSQGLDVIGPADDEAVTGPLHDTLPTATRSPLLPEQAQDADVASAAADPAEDEEGEQRRRFPGPRHAADEPDIAGSDSPPGSEASPGLASRVRKPPGGAVALVAMLSLGAIAVVTLRSPAPASAETCASPAYQQVLEKMGVTGKQAAKSKTVAPRPAKASGASSAARPATAPQTVPQTASHAASPSPAASPSASRTGPIQGLLGTLGGLLPQTDPVPSDSATPAPTPTPTGTPSQSPTTTPTVTPTATPTAKPTPKPTTKPSARPTHSRIRPRKPSPSPSDSPICAESKAFTDYPLNGITANPSKMTTADLVMHNLAYSGIRPVNDGAFNALWFTMDSSTSTPFELQPTVGSATIDIESSELTVSGNVQFYCSYISGDVALDGVSTPVRLTFTPDAPPPLVPTELELTDVTIQLVYVQSDTLTAKDLTITSA
jgi:hypothetical protein